MSFIYPPDNLVKLMLNYSHHIKCWFELTDKFPHNKNKKILSNSEIKDQIIAQLYIILKFPTEYCNLGISQCIVRFAIRIIYSL